jgi:hypothetical protein
MNDMKTKRLFFSICVGLPLMAGLTACTSDETTEAKPAKELLMVDKDISMPASETSWSVNINADCHWDVTSVDNSDWGELTVSPRSGDGNGTLILTSEENHWSIDRTATIIISTKGGLEQRINLRQMRSDAALSINQDVFEFTDNGGTQSLIIASNSDWTITGHEGISWLELGQTSGNTGTTEVSMRVKEAYDDTDRSVELTATTGSNSLSFTVTQGGKLSIFLGVSTNELPMFAGEGGSQTLSVESNAAWYAYVPSSVSWIHLEPAFGFGSGEILVVCDNNHSIQRQATFIVTAGTKTVLQSDILVKQERTEEDIIPEEPHNPDPHLSR